MKAIPRIWTWVHNTNLMQNQKTSKNQPEVKVSFELGNPYSLVLKNT